jgi:hypothetical protein
MLHRGSSAPTSSASRSRASSCSAYELTRDVLRAGELSRERPRAKSGWSLRPRRRTLPVQLNAREGTVWGSETLPDIRSCQSGSTRGISFARAPGGSGRDRGDATRAETRAEFWLGFARSRPASRADFRHGEDVLDDRGEPVSARCLHRRH